MKDLAKTFDKLQAPRNNMELTYKDLELGFMTTFENQMKSIRRITDPYGFSNISNSLYPLAQSQKVVDSIIDSQFGALGPIHQFQNNFIKKHFPISYGVFPFKNESLIQDKLLSFITSQNNLASSITKMMRNFDSGLQPIQVNPIFETIKGINDRLLRQVVIDENWDEVDQLEDISIQISETIENVLLDSKRSFEGFHNQIVLGFKEILKKSSSDKALKLIGILLALFSLLIAVEGRFFAETDNNKLATDKAFEEFRQEFNEKFESYSANPFRSSISDRDVNLRLKGKKNSQVIGVVRKGQVVNVLETRHKWLLVYYIDDASGETKSGFVFKKYFKSIN